MKSILFLLGFEFLMELPLPECRADYLLGLIIFCLVAELQQDRNFGKPKNRTNWSDFP